MPGPSILGRNLSDPNLTLVQLPDGSITNIENSTAESLFGAISNPAAIGPQPEPPTIPPLGGPGASAPLADASTFTSDPNVMSDVPMSTAYSDAMSLPDDGGYSDPDAPPAPEVPVFQPTQEELAAPTGGIGARLEPGIQGLAGATVLANQALAGGGGGGPRVKTVTKVAGDVNPADLEEWRAANQDYQDAMTDIGVTRAAGQQTAGLVRDDQLTSMNVDSARFDMEQRDLQEQLARQQARVADVIQQTAAMRIDPDNYYSSRGSGSRVRSAIAIMAGAVGQALMRSDHNAVVEFINGEIERDLRAQEINLNQANNRVQQQASVLGMMRQQIGDHMASYQAARASLLERSAIEMEAISLRFGSEESRAQTRAAAAQLRMQAAAATIASQQASSETTITSQSGGGGQRRASASEIKTFYDMATDGASSGSDVPLAEGVMRAAGLRAREGRAPFISDATEARKLTASVAATRNMRRLVDQIIAIRRRAGVGGTTIIDARVREDLETLRLAVQNEQRIAFEMGAPQAADYQKLERDIPSGNDSQGFNRWLRGGDAIEARYEGIYRNARQRAESQLDAAGMAFDDQEARAARYGAQ